jgi:tetratricopeptide (TPR) repeat protein
MMKLRTLLVLSVITLVGILPVAGKRQTRGENAELQAAANSISLERRIAQKIALIRDGERRGLEPLKLGRLWAYLASDYLDAMDLAKSEAAFNHALRLLEPLPETQRDYAIVLDGLGSLYVMSGRFRESERCRKRALEGREATGVSRPSQVQSSASGGVGGLFRVGCPEGS